MLVLINQVLQSSSLKSLLEWYFKVLQGAEGKLIAVQKISILKVKQYNGQLSFLVKVILVHDAIQAVREMSDCGALEDEELSHVVVWIFDVCIKAMESEGKEWNSIQTSNYKLWPPFFLVHEGTITEYINVMSSWCSKLRDSVPPGFIVYIPKGLLNLKASVKTSFCELLVKFFNPKRSQSFQSVRECIQKAFESMSSQLFQVSLQLEILSEIKYEVLDTV